MSRKVRLTSSAADGLFTSSSHQIQIEHNDTLQITPRTDLAVYM